MVRNKILDALGQKPTYADAKRHVRFAPKSGHVRCNLGCPLWANSGHRTEPSLGRPQRGERKIKFAYDA